jgi:hypothetical protein
MANEHDVSNDKPKKNMALIGAMVVVVVAIILLLLWVFTAEPEDEPTVATPGQPTEELVEPVDEPEPAPPEPQPQPVQEVPTEPEAPPLPELGNSDEALREAAAELAGSDRLDDFLVRDDIIRKSVRAISALEEGALVNKYRPVNGPDTPFVAKPVEEPRGEDDPQRYLLTEANFRRYDPYVNMLVHSDAQDVAAVYNRYYPLLEEAFKEQGVDKGSFRDVTLDAIDQLLAAPIIEEDIYLIQPSVVYKFADPNLEALPAAQKLMIRIGPENARKVKTFLRHLRAELD